MHAYTLVVSSPPHGSEVDFAKAAACLGLVPADFRIKTFFHVPEIWLAGTDRGNVEEAAQTLQDAGLNVVVVTGAEFHHVPPQSQVRTFTFGEKHFVAGLREGNAELAYDDPIMAVVHTPSSDTATSGEADDSNCAFLDMYLTRGSEVQRISVLQDTVDFEGLGEMKLPSRAGNMRKFFTEWEARFTQATIDRNLMNLRPRKTVTLEDLSGVKERRKGFSYGSRGLLELLDILAPDLSAVGQADFSSRLLYLTTRQSM